MARAAAQENGVEGPRVSVVIPTFNRRELVLRAVNSVLAQTEQNFELIVVDDGSTDGTRAALEGLDPRLHYHWQENAGPSAARNRALRDSSAPVVTFLDSDNRWLPDHLEVVLAALGNLPAGVLASTCPRFLLGGKQGVAAAKLFDPLPAVLFGNGIGFLSCVAVRRAALMQVGGFDESMWVAEDSDLFARVALVGPFVRLSRGTVHYQLTEGSLSRRPGAFPRFLEALAASAQRIAEQTESASEHRAAGAAAAARGSVGYLEACRALVAGELARVREELGRACTAYPELSRDPSLALARIVHVNWTRPGGEAAAILARSWPEPRARTPLTLRWAAVDAELRAHHLRVAARELLSPPTLLLRPDVAVRAFPSWRRARALGRARLGRESTPA